MCAVSAADWPIIGDWARNWAGTIPAFGVHPWAAGSLAGGWEEELEGWLLRFPSAWVGEIGLDAAKVDRVPMERQMDVFTRQVRLAARLGRGVNIHCVRAPGEVFAALEKDFSGKCVLHSFNEAPDVAARFAARGAYFSVGGLFARRESGKVRARVAALPADRLLLESDAFLEPGVDVPGELLDTFRRLAEVKRISPDALAGMLFDNARRLFDDAG